MSTAEISGIFASELSVSEEDKPKFEALRGALHDQLEPDTALLQIAFLRVVCSCWGLKLALRQETEHFKAETDPENGARPAKYEPAEHRLPSKWYGSSKADLKMAKRLLTDVRDDVAANGWIHKESWRDPMVEAFGEKFNDLLNDWEPMTSVDDILLAEMLSAKSKRFGMRLPPLLEAGLKGERVVVDPRLCQQMAVRLIEQKIQHLEDLERVNQLAEGGAGERRGASSLEFIRRLSVAAAKELEAAVDWYWKVKTLPSRG